MKHTAVDQIVLMKRIGKERRLQRREFSRSLMKQTGLLKSIQSIEHQRPCHIDCSRVCSSNGSIDRASGMQIS